MISRRLLHAGTRLVLFAALFAQVAVAANACLTAKPLRLQPAANAPAAHCEQADPISPNLCLYQRADQFDNSTPQPLIAAATSAVLTVRDAAGYSLPRTSQIVTGNAGHDPPIPIRFCSFLI